jgi:hypothetical protein
MGRGNGEANCSSHNCHLAPLGQIFWNAKRRRTSSWGNSWTVNNVNNGYVSAGLTSAELFEFHGAHTF